jgi:redox-regulated HSP33 family molecular chaperone
METEIIEYAQRIVEVLKDADPFTSTKALECAKIICDFRAYKPASEQTENQLASLSRL